MFEVLFWKLTCPFVLGFRVILTNNVIIEVELPLDLGFSNYSLSFSMHIATIESVLVYVWGFICP